MNAHAPEEPIVTDAPPRPLVKVYDRPARPWLGLNALLIPLLLLAAAGSYLAYRYWL